MEKKSKKTIIIGITSLFLVTLILLGLTYAYYRTRIIGNDAETSISVTSKKMEVTYEDGSAVLSTEGKIEPGFTASKTFYVENTGDQSVSYSIMLEDMTNEYERNQDWTYTLTENGTQIASGYLAVGRHQVLSGSRTISETTGTKNTYVLTITYVNSEEDQSEDMGMALSFKVNISEEQYTWESAPQGSLLNALKANQPTGSETTTPGQASSTENEARILETEDDYGTSYVYRGNVTNNYVNYSGMCWRVLRVQGDGTIKLVLADEKGLCNAETYSVNNQTTAFINDNTSYSYAFDYSADGLIYANSDISRELSTWMASKITDTSDLVNTDWCNDMSIASIYSYGYDYDMNPVEDEKLAADWYTDLSYGADAKLSLKCNMKGLNNSKALRYESIVGILTVDELTLAGVSQSNYLSTNANSDVGYWTMTPIGFQDQNDESTVSVANAYGYNITGNMIGSNSSIRPAIVLKSNVLLDSNVSGQNGTQTNPYVIS